MTKPGTFGYFSSLQGGSHRLSWFQASRFRLPTVLHLASLLTIGFLSATYAGNTWTGGDADDSLWTSQDNWGGALPGYGTITFSGSTRLVNTNDNGSLSHNQINFNSSSEFILRGNTVDLYDNGGTQAKVENNGSGTGTIDLTVDFEATAGTRRGEINPVSGDLIFNGTVNMNGSFVDEIHVCGGGSDKATFNAAINGSSKKFIIQDYNVVVFNAAMGYTGNTEIDQGELWIDSSGSINGSSTTYLGNGAETGNDAKIFISDANGGKTVSTVINVNQGDGSEENRELGGLNTSGTNTFSGNIVRPSDGNNHFLTLYQTAGGVIDFGGIISGNDTVRLRGPGTVRFSGANSYSANTEINNGGLHIDARRKQHV
ncbi:MAG: hypothetical protein O3A51_00305 [Verrucomicrobia bacterium]|nr:hypothetical protein [Verrucomicrobiota bacterium]